MTFWNFTNVLPLTTLQSPIFRSQYLKKYIGYGKVNSFTNTKVCREMTQFFSWMWYKWNIKKKYRENHFSSILQFLAREVKKHKNDLFSKIHYKWSVIARKINNTSNWRAINELLKNVKSKLFWTIIIVQIKFKRGHSRKKVIFLPISNVHQNFTNHAKCINMILKWSLIKV